MKAAIGVYTIEETLEEKKKHAADPSQIVWWNIKSKPAKGEPERIFFAAEGTWQGFFTIEKIESNCDQGQSPFNRYSIFLDEWHELEEKPDRSAFQGFTYDVPQICEEEGCSKIGKEWSLSYYDDEEEDFGDEEHILCLDHAADAGFCLRCGGFFGGVESYHFLGLDGYCSNCSDVIKQEFGTPEENEETARYYHRNRPHEEKRDRQ